MVRKQSVILAQQNSERQLLRESLENIPKSPHRTISIDITHTNKSKIKLLKIETSNSFNAFAQKPENPNKNILKHPKHSKTIMINSLRNSILNPVLGIIIDPPTDKIFLSSILLLFFLRMNKLRNNPTCK